MGGSIFSACVHGISTAAQATATVAIPAAKIAARLVITATRLVELQHKYANPPPEPRCAVRPGRRSHCQASTRGCSVSRRLPMGFPGAVFMRAPGSTNDHDLGLFSVGSSGRPVRPPGEAALGLYHLAWEVSTLEDLEELLGKAQRGRRARRRERPRHDQEPLRQGSRRHRVRGGLDRPGATCSMRQLWRAARRSAALTSNREKRRYGASTLGGVGISQT